VYNRLSDWLLEQEARPPSESDARHPTLRLHRMRALLHLVDADLPAEVDSDDRRLAALRMLLVRVRNDPPSPLRRVTNAALARTCDALVREGLCELSDILLAVAMFVHDEHDLDVIVQASMAPELSTALRTYATAFRAAEDGPIGHDNALIDLADSLPIARSARVEALRGGLLRTAHSLAAIDSSASLTEIMAGVGRRTLERLADNVLWLAQLVAAVGRRLDLHGGEADPESGIAIHAVQEAVDDELKGGTNAVAVAVADALEIICRELPPGFTGPIARSLQQLGRLPHQRPEGLEPTVSSLQSSRDRLLASWLPPSRTIGGFYVMGPLGTGGGGSVFVACRADERHAEAPRRFALKVPEYTGSAARSLSEDEFMRMFREEAGALLSLPQHPNLASFVTFDAGAKPKPILVMELVEGPSVDRLLDREEVTTADVLAIADGVACGLIAMHDAGVAHLDVKPSNVIMRNPMLASRLPVTSTGPNRPDPVLVDFGLAGRHIRPSCATVYYGAPEIWTNDKRAATISPMPADTYAFACLVYELLTGDLLFCGDTPVAILTAHLAHDGTPSDLGRLAEQDPDLTGLVELLSRGLRQDPDARISMAAMREALIELTPALKRHPWPLG